MNKIFHATLDDGRHVQIQLDTETTLLSVDVVDADEQGGCEVVRMSLNRAVEKWSVK